MARLFILPKGGKSLGTSFGFTELELVLPCKRNANLCDVQCMHMCSQGFVYRFVLPALDAMKLSHDSTFLLAMCASNASSWSIRKFDSKWRWRERRL